MFGSASKWLSTCSSVGWILEVPREARKEGRREEGEERRERTQEEAMRGSVSVKGQEGGVAVTFFIRGKFLIEVRREEEGGRERLRGRERGGEWLEVELEDGDYVCKEACPGEWIRRRAAVGGASLKRHLKLKSLPPSLPSSSPCYPLLPHS